jgi:hypothetical protein
MLHFSGVAVVNALPKFVRLPCEPLKFMLRQIPTQPPEHLFALVPTSRAYTSTGAIFEPIDTERSLIRQCFFIAISTAPEACFVFVFSSFYADGPLVRTFYRVRCRCTKHRQRSDCPPSALMRQIGWVEEGRISGSS